MKRVSAGLRPLIAIDKDNSNPMYRQLYDWFRSAILNGQLRPGQRLPSSRCLASELKVSRITILSAFEELSAEGYLMGSGGSGTYVARSIPDHLTRFASGNLEAKIRPPRSDRSIRISQLAARVLEFRQPPFHLETFRVGLPALDLFPINSWLRLLNRHWRQGKKEMMAYSDPMGYRPCREAIAEYLGLVRGVRCEPSQVMIVSGSQQGLEISARILLDPGDPVWIEEPGYPGARRAFTSAGAQLVSVPVDSDGLDVKEGIKRCPNAPAAYITPSHQFPLGMTMTVSRRMLLLDWAARNGCWIIEDDYDSDYVFDKPPVRVVQGLDADARVIYVGTFSKILFPSLRVGYLVLPADLIPVFSRVRDALDICPSTLYQAVLTDFIREGHLARHIRRMRVLYMERHHVLTAEIQKQFGATVELVSGEAGMHLVMLLPSGVQDTIVWQNATKAGISSWPLSFCYQKEPPRGGLILGYGGVDRNQIQAGVKKLAAVIRETI